jgi:hypothetical protein
VANGRAEAHNARDATVGQTPTFRGITTPNATCPVCKTRVYFYASPDGGRVYFDELGPPWQKHPCMDIAPSAGTRLSKFGSKPVQQPGWIRDGWRALRTVRFVAGVRELGRQINDWWVLETRDLRTIDVVSVYLVEPPEVRRNALVFLSPWGHDGLARLSWIADSPRGPEARTIVAWRPEHFNGLTIQQTTSLLAPPPEERPLAGLERLLTRESVQAGATDIVLLALSLDAAVQEARTDYWQCDADSALWVEDAVRDWILRRGWDVNQWLGKVMPIVRALY